MMPELFHAIQGDPDHFASFQPIRFTNDADKMSRDTGNAS